LPTRAIRAVAAVDADLGARIIPRMSWKLALAKTCGTSCLAVRQVILGLLGGHFRNAAVAKCVAQISHAPDDVLAPKERELIERFRMKRDLSEIVDQRTGWELV